MSNNKKVFAFWADDGYYYPATLGETGEEEVQVFFLDGTEDFVEPGQVIELDDAYTTMQLEADWGKKGYYYACELTDTAGKKMTVKYDEDGTIEKIDLVQLRGLPGKKEKSVSETKAAPPQKSVSAKNTPAQNTSQNQPAKPAHHHGGLRPVAGQTPILIGSLLLTLFGAWLLFGTLAAGKTVENGVTEFSVSLQGFFVPVFLLIIGLLGLLTGFTKFNLLLTISNFIGLKILVFITLLFAGAAFCDHDFLSPGFEKAASLVGIPIGQDSPVYLAGLFLLVLAVQIFYAGIDVAEYGAWDSYIIAHTASRAFFCLIFIPACYFFGLFKQPEKGIPAITFAMLMGGFILVFMIVRLKVSKYTALRISLLTLACLPLFVVYYLAVMFLYKYIGFIFNFTFLIPLAGLIALMKVIGRREKHTTKRFGHSICGWCENEYKGLFEFCSEKCKNDSKTKCRSCGVIVTTTKEQWRQERLKPKDPLYQCVSCYEASLASYSTFYIKGADGATYVSDVNGDYQSGGKTYTRL